LWYRRIAIRPNRFTDQQCRCFYSKSFTDYTTEDFNTLVSTTLAGFLYVSQLLTFGQDAADNRTFFARGKLSDAGLGLRR